MDVYIGYSIGSMTGTAFWDEDVPAELHYIGSCEANSEAEALRLLRDDNDNLQIHVVKMDFGYNPRIEETRLYIEGVSVMGHDAMERTLICPPVPHDLLARLATELAFGVNDPEGGVKELSLRLVVRMREGQAE